MVIMALVTTFMTTPLLMWLYEPAKDKVPYLQTKLEDSKDGNMRLLVCVHGTRSIPGMLNLVEIVRGSRKKPLAGFLLHLVEFSERSSAVLLVTKFRKDGRPFVSKEAEREGRDQVAVAFQAYARLSRVQMEAMTAISGFSNMHEDVCRAAQDKRANFIILPYHKHLVIAINQLYFSTSLIFWDFLLVFSPCSIHYICSVSDSGREASGRAGGLPNSEPAGIPYCSLFCGCAGGQGTGVLCSDLSREGGL